MTTVSQMIGQARYNAGAVAPAGGGYPAQGSQSANDLATDGYGSMGGSVLRNAAVGAAAGALVALPTGIGVPLGAGVGAAVGAGSALIRHPKVASVTGDALKMSMTGAAGGALLGTVAPGIGTVGGALLGAATGGATGIVNGVLKNVAGGKYSLDAAKTVGGRAGRGFLMGALTGAGIGAAGGALFGGIGAIPGAIGGAIIGGVGGALNGFLTGTVDAATGAKGTGFTSPKYPGQSGKQEGGSLKDLLPKLPGGSEQQAPVQQQYVYQGSGYGGQSVMQCPPCA